MKFLVKLLTFIFFLSWIAGPTYGQPKKRDRKVSFDCVVCHVTWHDDIDETKSLIPDIDAPIQIEGLPANIPTAAMCFTCHDGTVKDSRQVFSSNNHQQNLDLSHAKVQGLPLDKNGEIYCGTCHTPHSLKPLEPGGLAPFLREEVKNSALCLNCHSDQAQDHKSHPIHVRIGPQHNMASAAFFGENNNIECMTCHPVHGKENTTGVKGEDRKDLCVSCHEPYFNIELTDHDLSTSLETKGAAIGPSLGDQDACAACHSSHAGKDDSMWFTKLKKSDGKNAFCLSCHIDDGLAREKAFTHLGHPVSNKRLEKNIPALGIKAGDELQCSACHDPHQWEYSKKHAVTTANEEGTEYTSFLRLPDDAKGQLCSACHTEQEFINVSDHDVSRAGFQQHFRSSGVYNGQCSTCHDNHGAGGFKVSVSGVDADLSRMLCESCHSEPHYPTTVGGFDHPLGGKPVPKTDLPTYLGGMTCITCHDPHIWGAKRDTSLTTDMIGSDANSFLRISNWPKPELCLSCHAEMEAVLGTDHDLSDGDHSACSFCHTAHNSQAQYGILSFWDESAGASYNEKFCFSCHRAGGIAGEKIPQAWNHPHEYGTVTPNERGTGDWVDFPLFGETKPGRSFGFIDCFTCHDTHKWSFKEELSKEISGNMEGDYMTSFLRNPSHKTLCTDCHGTNTIWKYNYYHDPVKRKRY
ncbi:cytochrome c3 family protein [bacterium]|nr:cytochrome c3 family protein [bacterium]